MPVYERKFKKNCCHLVYNILIVGSSALDKVLFWKAKQHINFVGVLCRLHTENLIPKQTSLYAHILDCSMLQVKVQRKKPFSSHKTFLGNAFFLAMRLKLFQVWHWMVVFTVRISVVVDMSLDASGIKNQIINNHFYERKSNYTGHRL